MLPCSWLACRFGVAGGPGSVRLAIGVCDICVLGIGRDVAPGTVTDSDIIIYIVSSGAAPIARLRESYPVQSRDDARFVHVATPRDFNHYSRAIKVKDMNIIEIRRIGV